MVSKLEKEFKQIKTDLDNLKTRMDSLKKPSKSFLKKLEKKQTEYDDKLLFIKNEKIKRNLKQRSAFEKKVKTKYPTQLVPYDKKLIDKTSIYKGRRVEPPKKRVILLNHQKRFIEGFLFSNLRSAIVFHGVGTGKTFTAVSVAKVYLQMFPKHKVMFVTPPAVLSGFIESMNAYGLPALDKRISYYSYVSFTNKQIDTKNTLIIIDEAHNLRTEIISSINDEGVEHIVKGSRPAITIQRSHNAHKVVLLTATPFINKPYDIENLLAIGEGRMSHSPTVFGDIASNETSRYDYFKYRISKYDRTFDNSDFPEMRERLVPIIVQKDDEIADKIRALAGRENPAYVFSRLSSLLIDSKKMDYIYDIISDKKNKNNKYVIYTAFIKGVDKLIKKLKEKGINPVVISGKANTASKSNAVTSYNNYHNKESDDYHKSRIMIITKAGAEGVSLNETRGLFVIDGVWNEALYHQIVARAIRYKSHANLPLKERYVDVYKLFVCFPNEADILEKLNRGIPFDWDFFINAFKLFKKNEKIKKGGALKPKPKGKAKFTKKDDDLVEGHVVSVNFDRDLFETLRGEERKKYLEANLAFGKDKHKYETSNVLSKLDGYPSTDFYMFVLQKNKEHIINKLLNELSKIPSLEQSVSDIPEANKLFTQILNQELSTSNILKNLRKILVGEEKKAGLVIKRNIDNRDSSINKWIENKKSLTDQIKKKVRLRVKQEFFTPDKIVKKLIELSGIATIQKRTTLNVLEPSAGWGNIVKGVLDIMGKRELNVNLDMVEIMDSNRKQLKELVKIAPFILSLAKEPNFLKYVSSKDYDYIFMNPPFHLQKRNNKDLVIDVYSYHFVMRAYAMLAVGGILVAITGHEWKDNKIANKFYGMVQAKVIDDTVVWEGTDIKKGSEVKALKISYIYIKKLKEDSKLDDNLLLQTSHLIKNKNDDDDI